MRQSCMWRENIFSELSLCTHIKKQKTNKNLSLLVQNKMFRLIKIDSLIVNTDCYLGSVVEKGVYLLTGRSVASSFKMDLPSISAGMSRPAMSSRVGARSTFKTMWGLLQESSAF